MPAMVFDRLPGVPLEQAYVSDVITIEWFGNRCHPDSTQSLYRRVTNRCDLNSSGTVESDVTDTQLYILVVVRLGPVRRESLPSTRSNRARPASLSSLHPEQSSDAARQVVPVQRCADSGHPSPSWPHRGQHGFMTPCRRQAPSKSIECIRIVPDHAA